jgi:hypothetical protein
MILNDATPGSAGLVYWYEKTSMVVPEEQIQKMRQKAMSDRINASIQSAMYSAANQQTDVETAMQRGWDEANKQIDMLENGTEMKSEMFLIGDTSNNDRIKEIECTPNFRGWVNPYLIQQILNT